MFRMRAMTALAAVLVPGAASAFDFGFVRVPDSMDTLFLWLAAAIIPLLVGLLATKPADVPFNKLYANVGRLYRFAKLFYFGFVGAFAICMVLLFVGMGLQRAAEAGL